MWSNTTLYLTLIQFDLTEKSDILWIAKYSVILLPYCVYWRFNVGESSLIMFCFAATFKKYSSTFWEICLFTFVLRVGWENWDHSPSDDEYELTASSWLALLSTQTSNMGKQLVWLCTKVA